LNDFAQQDRRQCCGARAPAPKLTDPKGVEFAAAQNSIA
jgi:hypothetical protein